jgi:tRNA pseudouridine38-40 synthase
LSEESGRRIRLVVEYDGTDFGGWQRQRNAPSVQAEIEEAVFRMTGERTRVGGAGRTDAGVHALGQVASFTTTNMRIPIVGFRRGLNAYLPPTISVVAADEVPESFDPRRHAHGKLYRYRIWNADSRSPIERRTSWHMKTKLDHEAMARAAVHLIGDLDFAAFRAADCERQTTVRRLTRLAVDRPGGGPLITVEVEGNAFLKNMVRILVGTLYEVGRGAQPPEWIQRVLDGRDRTQAGQTAPPEGLFLVRVDYDLALPPRA